MPQLGLHPMRHLVRHVFPNGSSILTQMSWRRPYAGLEIVHIFHDVDLVNGNKDDEDKREAIGQRAKFQNRFKSSAEPSPRHK